MMINAVVKPSFVHTAKGLHVITITEHMWRCRSHSLFSEQFPCSYIYNCYSSYFVFPQGIHVFLILMTLYNSHSSIQEAPASPLFSFRSSNEICGKSPYVSNIAGPLCSSSITFSPYLLLRSLVPEVEVTRMVTQSQSDTMHKLRFCKELGTSREGQHKTTKVHAMES